MRDLALSRIKIAGKELEIARCEAYPERPTIVFLHEALGSVSHWKRFPLKLAHAAKCNALVYSRVGHGDSEGPVEMRSLSYMDRQARTVLGPILEKLQIPRPVLFGHSEGAVISLFFASAFPNASRALIVEAPVITTETVTVTGMAKIRDAYETLDLKRRLGRHHRDPDAVFGAFTKPWLTTEAGFREFMENLHRVTCPALIVQGDRDEYASVEQSSILASHVPHARVEIVANCGHSPHREHPDAIIDLVCGFLSSL